MSEPLAPKDVVARVNQLRALCSTRDSAIKDVMAARAGDYRSLAGDLLPEVFDKPLVANLVDTAARDIAEVMAPLPSIQCVSLRQNSERAKQAAQKRTRIAKSYVENSRLQGQMFGGADRFSSFGFMVYVADLDLETKTPWIRVDDAVQAYYLNDARGRTKCYATVTEVPVRELIYLYPQYAANFINAESKYWPEDDDKKKFDIITYYDDDQLSVIVPECDNLKISHIENPIGRCPVRVVERPFIAPGKQRGQFDDVIWVQVFRAIVAAYTMSSLEQSVNAPIIVPSDVNQIDIGPLETLQTDNPGGVGRLKLDVSQGLFPEQQMLSMEQMKGSRYPEGRSGNIDASIITGQGVQALMGTFDTQIQTFQTLNTAALEDMIAMCFELDQTLWPGVSKTVQGNDEGSRYEITYTPKADIASDFTVRASYGAIAGLDPNRALVFLLQAQAGGFISKETAQRYMPVDLNIDEEKRSIEIEMMREVLAQSVAMTAQAIPQMAANGQDPRMVVEQFSAVLKEVQGGASIEEAVAKVFAPKQSPEEQAQADPLAALLGGAGQGAPAGSAGPGGGAPPSPAQDLLMQLAGNTAGGQANLQSNVTRRQPAA